MSGCCVPPVFRENKVSLHVTLYHPPRHAVIRNTSNRQHTGHGIHKVNEITIDCQKGGPPITASKCMIIMKICTSVTSILIRYKKPEKAELLTTVSGSLVASLAQRSSIMHNRHKSQNLEERGERRRHKLVMSKIQSNPEPFRSI